MKKIRSMMFSFVLMFILVACSSNVDDAKTKEVDSKVFTQEEITSVIDGIKDEFKKRNGEAAH